MLVVQDISLAARKRVGLHGQRNEINSWLRQEGSLPQSAVVRITYRDIGSPAKKPNFLATQRQLTYLVAPDSGLRRLYFVVLRLMYVMDIEELNAVSCCVLQALIIPQPRPTILALGLNHGNVLTPPATSVGLLHLSRLVNLRLATTFRP